MMGLKKIVFLPLAFAFYAVAYLVDGVRQGFILIYMAIDAVINSFMEAFISVGDFLISLQCREEEWVVERRKNEEEKKKRIAKRIVTSKQGI